MSTIFDYVLENNEIITNKNFNPVDSLILTRLSYFPIHKILNPDESMDLKRLLRILECFSEKIFVDYENDMKLIKTLIQSKRFNNLIVSNCVEKIDNKNFEQFGAIVIDLGFVKYISFKGTDKSIVGIKEDLDMSYKNIPAQNAALNYFNDISNKLDGEFILGGHSKGGNVAIYAAIFTSDLNKSRIQKIYNFDGPGFLDEVLQNKGYDKILNKIVTILPTSSFVGLLLNRKEKVKLINSNNFFVMQHNIYSFEIKGKDFEYVKDFTKISQYANDFMTKFQEKVSSEKKKQIIDNIYNFIEKDEIKNLNDIDIKSIINLIKLKIKNKKKEKIMEKSEIFKVILNSDFEFSAKVCIDSREVKKGDIFIAIRNGNNFVKDVIEKGGFPIYEKGDYTVGLKVKDSIKFLQEMATSYREKLNAKVIGITGSNGKTTVKDILGSVLKNSYKTQGNHNNLIGEPLTILNCPIDAKFLILEMGMSESGEIDKLASIAKPDYSIITNIGDSHIEYLKTRENVFKAKCEIIPHTKKDVIVPEEDEYLKTLENKNVSKVKIEDFHITDKGTTFTFKGKKYETNLYGRHNVLNICLVLELLEKMDINLNKSSLKHITLTDMRFQIIRKNGNIYINDAYNAAPKSVKSSLETLNEIFKDKKKYIVLADMLELGENAVQYHKDLKKVLDNIKYEKIYLYGQLMSNLDAKNCIHTMDKLLIKKQLDKLKGAVIFLKGSRGMKLEEIIGSDN